MPPTILPISLAIDETVILTAPPLIIPIEAPDKVIGGAIK